MGAPFGSLRQIKPEYGDEELNKAMDDAIAEINKLSVPKYKADRKTQEVLRRWNQDAEALILRSKGIVRK